MRNIKESIGRMFGREFHPTEVFGGVVSQDLPVAGLRPERSKPLPLQSFPDSEKPKIGGVMHLSDNLHELGEKVTGVIDGAPWVKKLMIDAGAKRKSVKFMVALGSISFFVAAAGVELTVREGRDIKELTSLYVRTKKKIKERERLHKRKQLDE